MNFWTTILNLSIFEQIIAALFLLSGIIQLIYYFVVFSKLAFYREEIKQSNNYQPVSVIISAHNEDYNLQKNLPTILNQNYPDFEVVVVNHASTDDTSEILADLKPQYGNLKVVTIEQDLNFFKGKKFPLSIGIKSSKNEILLLTDADCNPVSDRWIESMALNYTSKTEVVLGYGPYIKSGGFLNQLIRYDTFMIAVQYFSFALMGFPYMGVGRNLSYRKSTFYKNKGFTSHYKLESGDDDLFIRQVANSANTKIEISAISFMYSKPKNSFNGWLLQKQRHLSTGKAYSNIFKLLLGSYSFSQVMLYLTFITLLCKNVLLIATLALMLVTIISRLFIQKKAASKLGENQILLFSLFGDIIHVFLLPIITIISLIRKPVSWK
ncbi:MAG: glycosyltransferase [Bacteroidetes bacterium]|nr:glycosyltransferase [Bacteroidota bacterium]MBL6943683.1 glycosyltransferase [Bacteroidales bacterium]